MKVKTKVKTLVLFLFLILKGTGKKHGCCFNPNEFLNIHAIEERDIQYAN